MLADAQGARVAAHLLASTGPRTGDAPSYLVVGNGSARRTEKAPGHLDERAAAFDADLGRRLEQGSLAGIDRDLARASSGPTSTRSSSWRRVPDLELEQVDYDDDAVRRSVLGAALVRRHPGLPVVDDARAEQQVLQRPVVAADGHPEDAPRSEHAEGGAHRATSRSPSARPSGCAGAGP